MKKILAPTDFSKASYNACLYAAKMAKDINAKLVLLHVMESPISVTESAVTKNELHELSMKDELKQLKKKLSAKTNNKVNIITKNILGTAEFEIKELCRKIDPFVVIMGTHTYSWIDQFFIGSTTLYSAKHLRHPVLVIPPNTKYKPIKQITMASDLKNVYDVPIHEIGMIVKCFNAKLEILHVSKNKNTIDRNSLESLLIDHHLVHLSPQFFFVESEDILKGIKARVKQNKTDLLLIIPKKHGPFHKSRSKDFIFYSDVPVMAIHENDVVEQALPAYTI